MAYKSKYSGEEVEGLLDKVNDGGTGEGITDIQPEAEVPLNLSANIAGSLATISGSVDCADTNEYGVVGLFDVYYREYSTECYDYGNVDTVDDLFDEGNWNESTNSTGLSGEQLYDVYKVAGIGKSDVPNKKDGVVRKLAVKTGWPRISKISEATKDEVAYVLCLDSNNKLKKVPVSEF